LISNKAHHLIK